MPLIRAMLVENAITAEQKQELIGRITHAVATVYTEKLRHSGDAAPLGRTARRASREGGQPRRRGAGARVGLYLRGARRNFDSGFLSVYRVRSRLARA
jgi:hypothetical protein